MSAAAENVGTPAPARTAGRWTVVPADSRVRFRVRDKLVATVHGSLPIEEGAAVLDGDGEVTRAWIGLAVPGIATGNAHRDRDLQKPGLLDAASFPSVRVEVEARSSVATGSTARAVVHARGRSAPLDLTVETVAVDATAADTSADRAGVRVTGRLDRTPLEIRAPSFVIGRFLDLEADLIFRRQPDDDDPDGREGR
ncbi:MAG: YceI family protein [Pseudonocardia sp.]|nr:YceI family protein [Pseudonocardia sp.]